MSRIASRLIGLLLILSPAYAFGQQQVTIRTSEFVYDAATGQLRIERIQPNNGAQPSPVATPNDCVETEYTLDPATGNRTAVTTRNCSGATPTGDHVFSARTTTFHFEARNDDSDTVSALHGTAIPGPNDHASGPYETRTVNALGHTEHKHYDVRFGVVARMVGPNGLPTTWTYDDYGRRTEERRADDTRTETRYFTCTWSTNPADPAPAPQPARAGGAAAVRPCLNFSETVTVLFDSARYTDASGTPTQSVQVLAQTAYFIQSVPRASDGSQNGPISVVHFDALNREVAKETQSYDGRWVRTISAYDGLGLVAATYAAHFVTDSDLTPVRQITRSRDLRHRPTIHEFVAVEGQAAVQASMTYNGLETRATDPAGRTTVTRKNAAGQTAQTVDAYLATLDMAYDAKGNLVRTRDALGIETSVTYNVRGLKVALADPDKGSWAYRYNALGELVWQESPNQRAGVYGTANATTMRYDTLGRLLERDEASQRARWVYDTAPNGIGKLAETFTLLADGITRDFQRSFTYDARGRPSSTTTTIDRAYGAAVTYDARTGQVATQRYPTGFTLLYQYNALGFVQRVRDNADPNRVYWSVDSLGGAHPYDARGNLVRQRLGDPTNPGGVQTFDVYDRASGKARQLRAGIADGTFATQNATYTYDRLTGNLAERFEATTNLRETFGYDTIDRLISHTLANTGVPAANRTVTVRYNAIGNILWKSDVGVYTYGAAGSARPHAVVNAAGIDYLYDANGNVQSTSGAIVRTHEWASFDLPLKMQAAGRRIEWKYGGERQRVVTTTTNGSLTRTQFLVHPDARGGLFFEREVSATDGVVTRIENRHYLMITGAGVIGVVKTEGDGNGTAPSTAAGITRAVADQTQYWHKDPLGSIVAVTNARGELVERMAFDAWGRRMQASGAPDSGSVAAGTLLNAAHGDRGFTGHEMLDELGLVHMNGRIYDPALGRFFSPDPFVQAPELLQSYNRYAYVLNRPLAGTDPDGEWWQIPLLIFGAVLAAEGNQYWRMVGQFMMMASLNGIPALGEAGIGIINTGGAYTNAFLSATIATTISSGGDLGAGLKDGVFAMLTAGIGTGLKGMTTAQVLAHALVGCVRGAASGGECGPSAAAAAFGKLATIKIGDGLSVGQFVATTIAGGTASVIGGGKFANGAAQAAFGYLYNAGSGGRGAVRTGIRGFASLVQDMATADFQLAEPEVWGRTGSGERFRVDGVFVHSDGHTMFGGAVVICEAKCGPTSELSERQVRVYDAISRNDFYLEGPRAVSVANKLGFNVDTAGRVYVPAERFGGPYLGVYEGSAAHLKPSAQSVNWGAIMGVPIRGRE